MKKYFVVAIVLFTFLNHADGQYDGASQDAEWRALADQRIRDHRKVQVTIQVKDRQGQPLTNAPIHVKMTNHDFLFGSVVSYHVWASGNQAYRQRFLELFNYVGFENRLKPYFLMDENPTIDLSEEVKNTREVITWAQNNDLKMRGHAISYNMLSNVAQELLQQMSKEEFIEWTKQRVTNKFSWFPYPQIQDWDIQNEASHYSDMYRKIEADGLAEVWIHAQEHTPEMGLVLNDNHIISQFNPNNNRIPFNTNLIGSLQAAGARIDAFGFEGHQTEKLPPIEYVYEKLEQFGEMVPELKVTEFDFKVGDEVVPLEIQGDFLRDFLTICFSHPQMTSFTTWGFWTGAHWQGNGPFFNTNWTHRPSYYVWKDLVFNQWWTEDTLQTDQAGQLTLDAFKGTYLIGTDGQYAEYELLNEDQTVMLDYSVTFDEAPLLDVPLEHTFYLDSGKQEIQINSVVNPQGSLDDLRFQVKLSDWDVLRPTLKLDENRTEGTITIDPRAPGISEVTLIVSNQNEVFNTAVYPIKITIKENEPVLSLEESQSRLIYPNPTTGLINISGLRAGIELQLMNLEGKIIKRQRAASSHTFMDISDLVRGLYLLKYEMDGYEESIKIIVTK